ncbi:MAG TPA: cytoplasmic protein, partial [Desulfobacteraceae bacterium]|nr:cytoplasmic protein [Desulfobacteraceae bacterium]
LEERVNDLTEQGIFFPRMIVLDGLPFDEAPRKTFTDLKSLARKHGVPIWFTVRTHRHAPPGPDGIPLPMLHVADLFEAIFELHAEGNDIRLQSVRK